VSRDAPNKALANYRSTDNQHLTIGRLPNNTKNNLFCCLISII